MVAKVRAIEAKRDSGMVEQPADPDASAEWLEHWLDNIAPRRVAQRTLESYEQPSASTCPGIGRHRLDRLRPEHLDQLYTALLDNGYSPASVLRHHRILSRALTVAVQRGHVPRNVAALVDPPASAAERPRHRRSTSTRPAPSWKPPPPYRNSARWTVALALGLRQSEALALQWKDIDLLNSTLTVRRSIHRVRGGGLIYEEPKSKRSQRTLALPLPLVAELHRHKAAQLGERMLAGSEWHDEDLVFAQANGRPIDKKTDYDDWTAPAAEGRRPPRPAARRPAHRRHPAAVRERAPAGGHGAARPQPDAHDDGHLQPRHAGPGPRGGRPDGRPAAAR